MRARDDRGVAFPSPLVILSILAVAMAGIAYVTTMDRDDGGMESVSKPATTSSASPSTEVAPVPPPVKKKAPKVVRSKVYVEVYNNTNISGLAGSAAGTAQSFGWQVVASDNWHGTIPASTVYYPERLKAAGKMLAKDLGIARVIPAVDPMGGDRLTVILTPDYAS
ncbi:LytR C-terminal domain-containing protein [Nocardioides jensenii]|uniref:LytR C-terminal domain-containing protein n=1 Tax=Nocardioides jensenii TaxID=1843 RepID=UPI0008350066|nr:LytR C-terminal domain-containing protein [Nocardioides jensenii]